MLVERREGGFHVGGVPPTPRTPLLGRDDELARIRGALATSRMVTLTGPGGAGKTRLALAAVSDDPPPAGVAWVELAEVADAKLVAETVRSALGVPGTSGSTPTQAIVDRIRDAEVVVALDNCEHVAGAAADVADHLLDGCPRLRVVTTSREPLAVEGELIWPVAPLAAPGVDVTTAEAVRDSPAGRLFEVRAQAVLPSFRITDANATAIARLCRRLDGLPLAIELAAARVRVLSVEQIVAGLDDVFRLLAGGARTGPPRHQSLRATLDWGHDLLTEPERIVFRRLGVFPGSFDLAAAETVAADAVAPGELLDLLARLVDRSLVTPRPAGEQMRYRLLAPIRSYARERLAAAGERSLAGAAHLDHYADLVERSEPLLAGAQQAAELDRLEMEGNNLRVALAFAAECRPPPLAGLRLAAGLSRLCSLRGHYREGRYWLDWAATVPADVPPGLRAKALLGSGSLAHLQCDYPAAVRRLEAARAGYAELDDRVGVAAALQALGSVARERGRYARAEALHREVLQLADECGDERLIAQCHGYLGFAAWLQEQWAEAEIECRRALTLFRRLGDGEGIVWSLLSLGIVAQYRGELETAGDLLDRAHRMSCELSYREGIAWALHERGLLAMRRGDPVAEDLLRNALVAQRALGDRWRTASVLLDLAAYAQGCGEDSRAVALLGAAEAVRTEIGTEIAPCERADHDRVESAARDRLSAEDFARAWAHGQTAVLDDLLTEAPKPPEAPDRPVVRTSTPLPTNSHAQLRIRALGEANVYCGDRMLTPSDWGYAKPRELLFLLVGCAPQTKSEIGRALWPDIDGPQLRNAFHTALRDLRRALGDPAWVTFSAGRYTLDRSREHWCDLEIFEEALAAARQARPAEAALPHLQRAIGAYAGEFGAGLTDAEWLQPRRADLARSFTRALSTAGRLLAADGRLREAADLFRRAVDHDPLDEAAHRQLMAALVRTGEAAQAARVYQQLASRLHTELGIAPAAETRAVYQRLERTR